MNTIPNIKPISFSRSSQRKKDDSKYMDKTTSGVVLTLVTTSMGGAIGEGSYHLDQIGIKESIKTAEQNRNEYQKFLDEEEKERTGYKTTLEEAKKAKVPTPFYDINESPKFEKIKNKLEAIFHYAIIREKEQKPTVFPNSIMLKGENAELNSDLIHHLGQKSDCHFVQIKHTDNILEHLKKAEKSYQETQKRTLLHVENLDQLISPSTSPHHVIGDLRSIMHHCAEDYHTTIIFSTKDAANIDRDTIIHRVDEKIEVNISKTDYEEMKHNVKTSREDIKLSTQRIEQLKEKMKPFTKKIEELNDKLKKLPKTKIWVGLAAGFIGGIIGVILLSSNSENKTTQ